MIGAFVSTGGAVLIAIAFVVGVATWRVIVNAPMDTDLWEGGEAGIKDERRARTTLYLPPSCDRRTDNVVPVRTDKW